MWLFDSLSCCHVSSPQCCCQLKDIFGLWNVYFINILKMLSLIVSSLRFSLQHAKERSFTHKLWRIKSRAVWNFSLTIIDFYLFSQSKNELLIVCHDALLHSASFSSIFSKSCSQSRKGQIKIAVMSFWFCPFFSRSVLMLWTLEAQLSKFRKFLYVPAVCWTIHLFLWWERMPQDGRMVLMAAGWMKTSGLAVKSSLKSDYYACVWMGVKAGWWHHVYLGGVITQHSLDYLW